MTLAATTANGFGRRFEPSRFIANASPRATPRAAPAAAAARRLHDRPYPARLRAIWPLTTCHQYRRNASSETSLTNPYGPDSRFKYDFIPPAGERYTPMAIPPVIRGTQPGRYEVPKSSNPPRRTAFDVPKDNPAKPIKYKEHLRHAVRRGDVTTVIKCVLAAADDTAFIASIPPVTFTEMLRLATSRDNWEDIKESLEHSWWMADANLPRISSLMNQLLLNSDLMMRIRRKAGVTPGLADYKLLLQCAAAAENKTVAFKLWDDMAADAIKPDVECYNALMHAFLWDRHLPASKTMWRYPISWKVDDYYLKARAAGRLAYAPQVGGNQEMMNEVFDHLLSEGGIGDEETMVNLLIARAREGNAEGIKDILSRVWNIQADEIVATGTQKTDVARFRPSSPLCPTIRLVSGIAHALGASMQAPHAVRVIDFISTAYDIPVATSVWSELLTWVWVQSQPHHHYMDASHAVSNRLPFKTAEQLWQKLTKPPYNVRPTMKMYHLTLNCLTMAQLHHVAIDRIRDGISLYLRHMDEGKEAKEIVDRAKRDFILRRPLLRPLSSSMRLLHLRMLRLKRDRVMVMYWCYTYLSRGFSYAPEREEIVTDTGRVEFRKTSLKDTHPEWPYQTVPDFIREFGLFCPRVVEYNTHSGFVELDVRVKYNDDRKRRFRRSLAMGNRLSNMIKGTTPFIRSKEARKRKREMTRSAIARRDREIFQRRLRLALKKERGTPYKRRGTIEYKTVAQEIRQGFFRPTRFHAEGMRG